MEGYSNSVSVQQNKRANKVIVIKQLFRFNPTALLYLNK